MADVILRVENVEKKYKLGQIGGTTLRDELQRLGARILKKEDPTKRIGEKNYNQGETFMAIDGVSFDVKQGERVGIIGHNGAGKSTLLKLISRITAPTNGTISLNGRVASMLEVGTGFHPELTGRENIYMNGAILGMSKKEIDKKIDDIIDFSEVRQFIDTPVKRYSSGMYVKLAFSVAAHLDSEIMIMDEVLAVGDMAFQQKCLNKMRDVSNEEGRTILYVSHNMNTIRSLCDRVIVLSHGKIIYDGTVEEGISYYLGISADTFPAYYDLSAVERTNPTHAKAVKLTDFEFVGKEAAIFDKQKEKLNFKIRFNAGKDISGLRMIASVSTIHGERLGFAQSAKPFADVKKGKTYEAYFEMDVSGFIAGKYNFILDVFNLDDNNNHLSYDHPNIEIPFLATESEHHGIKSNITRWGAVEFSTLECLKADELN